MCGFTNIRVVDWLRLRPWALVKGSWSCKEVLPFLNRFIKYLVVGSSTALIYFGLLAILLEKFKLGSTLSITGAYATSVTFHFFANRHLTFKSGSSSLVPQIIRYSVMVVSNYLITLLVIFLFVDRMHFNTYVGASIALATTIVVGFFVARLWVFRGIENKNE